MDFRNSPAPSWSRRAVALLLTSSKWKVFRPLKPSVTPEHSRCGRRGGKTVRMLQRQVGRDGIFYLKNGINGFTNEARKEPPTSRAPRTMMLIDGAAYPLAS